MTKIVMLKELGPSWPKGQTLSVSETKATLLVNMGAAKLVPPKRVRAKKSTTTKEAS